MTIGNLGNSLAASGEVRNICWNFLKLQINFIQGENPDFETLVDVRKIVSEATDIKLSDIELSMGMSNDFEEAIKMGSTNVRVGSSIFGSRNYPVKENETSEGVKTSLAGVETVTNKMENLSA